MSRQTTIVALQEIKDINLTPLIDLTFLLLITFIITFPLIEQGIPIDLPETAAENTVETSSRTITLDREGTLYLDEMQVSRDELTRALKAVSATARDTVVRIRADESIPYGKLAEVLRLLREAELFRTALVMQAE